ncbi:MAG: threonylcarbamoyl-AMP synthase [Clostridiales bacterium]|nr:threonylcarbamoyl-AMP synthase [Clostridiales bacterium]
MKTIVAGNSQDEILQAAKILRTGGLVVFPTETVYGLGANALDGSAAGRIYAAKGRPSDNPLIVHLADPEQAKEYCFPTPLFEKLAARFMPGPLTVILPKKDCIPETVTGGLDTVGIRVPSHPTAKALLQACGLPIAAPSANLSTKPSPTRVEHAVRDLYGRVDMIIDGGPCIIGLESTIVKLTGEDSMTLLRPGGVTYEQLCEICRNVTVDKAVYSRLGDNEKAEAPGMKYRHYAPSAQVIVVEGPHEAVIRYIKQKSVAASCGVICFEEDKTCFSGPVFSLGSRLSTEQQAQKLFDCLRAIDGQKEIERVYAFMPETGGLGLAVMNRLVKAAGFIIEHVKEEE